VVKKEYLQPVTALDTFDISGFRVEIYIYFVVLAVQVTGRDYRFVVSRAPHLV
jgi:hypothetical protein